MFHAGIFLPALWEAGMSEIEIETEEFTGELSDEALDREQRDSHLQNFSVTPAGGPSRLSVTDR